MSTSPTTTYSICYEHERRLRKLAQTDADRATIARLYEARGTAQDMWDCVALYEGAGDHDHATMLADMIAFGGAS